MGNDRNSWPGGRRRPLTQSEHHAWNAREYPGTRQLCSECGEPTGRCEDDSLFMDDDEDEQNPVCEDCWMKGREE